LWYRQKEDDNVQCHIDTSKCVSLCIDIHAFPWMLSIPAFPNEANRIAVQASGDEARRAEQPDNDHESVALPLEGVGSENP
jgi:hypothetical protein